MKRVLTSFSFWGRGCPHSCKIICGKKLDKSPGSGKIYRQSGTDCEKNMGVFPSGQWGQTVNLLLFSFWWFESTALTKNSSIRTGYWSFCFVETDQGDRSGWIRTASAAVIRPGGKKAPAGLF